MRGLLRSTLGLSAVLGVLFSSFDTTTGMAAKTGGIDALRTVLDNAAEVPGSDMFVEELKEALPHPLDLSNDEVDAFVLLAEQTVRRGIDYATLNLGWDHPDTRTAYREARHRSITNDHSRRRQRESRDHMLQLLKTMQEGKELPSVAIPKAFLKEVGVGAPDYEGDFQGVLAALRGELVLPLRALNEGQTSMQRTFNGAPVPAQPIADCVGAITKNVAQGTYKQWRYSNPVGQKQMEGLTEAQKAVWMESTSRDGPKGLRTHEDEDNELGFFWATKIGGPSHGFDIEGQCLLPLLSNARHKVLLVSDPAWPHHPSGRAHFRLLWTARENKPLLWLETINSDFRARVNTRDWAPAVLTHAAEKAERMGVMLWVDNHHAPQLAAITKGRGEVTRMQEQLVLRPSNGVVEASDYLGHKHDWPQMTEEITSSMSRVVFVPSSIGGGAHSEM